MHMNELTGLASESECPWTPVLLLQSILFLSKTLAFLSEKAGGWEGVLERLKDNLTKCLAYTKTCVGVIMV